MEVGLHIKTNRSSHCRGTGCAGEVVDRREEFLAVRVVRLGRDGRAHL
jgi:RNase P/RNase MRP subunit p29